MWISGFGDISKKYQVFTDQARFCLSTTGMKRRMTKKKMNLIWSAVAYYMTVLEYNESPEWEGTSSKELLEAWYALQERFPHLEL